MKKNILTILAMLLATSLLLGACAQAESAAPQGAVGSIVLSVNPEIEIEYDRNGIVVEIEGRNDDGRELLLAYKDYEGKTCAQVTQELVDMIYASGSFQLELEGNPRNIVVKLEQGSAYPSNAFLEEIAAGIRLAVANRGGSSETMVVDRKDLNEAGLIGLEKAKELVLAQLNLAEADFTEKEYQLDDGIYELEFTVDGVEYEYEVDGRTGKILEADMEHNDDWEDVRYGSPAITLEDAKNVVFTKLGISEDQVRKLQWDYDDGRFELEFTFDGMEYEFEVDGQTGQIIKEETEKDD